MSTNPRVLYELARLHHDELLHEAARQRAAGQIRRSARVAPVWSSLRDLIRWPARAGAIAKPLSPASSVEVCR